MCSPTDDSFPSDTALYRKECRLNPLCPNCILLPFSDSPLPLSPSPFPTESSSFHIASAQGLTLCTRMMIHLPILRMYFIPRCSKTFHFPGKCSLIKRFQYLGCSWSISLLIALTSASSFLLTASALLNQTNLTSCLQPQLWESHEHGEVLVYINPSSQ